MKVEWEQKMEFDEGNCYPVRVKKQLKPPILVVTKLLKYNLLRSMSTKGWRTSIAFGPWRANRDLSSWIVISAFPPSLYRNPNPKIFILLYRFKITLRRISEGNWRSILLARIEMCKLEGIVQSWSCKGWCCLKVIDFLESFWIIDFYLGHSWWYQFENLFIPRRTRPKVCIRIQAYSTIFHWFF